MSRITFDKLQSQLPENMPRTYVSVHNLDEKYSFDKASSSGILTPVLGRKHLIFFDEPSLWMPQKDSTITGMWVPRSKITLADQLELTDFSENVPEDPVKFLREMERGLTTTLIAQSSSNEKVTGYLVGPKLIANYAQLKYLD